MGLNLSSIGTTAADSVKRVNSLRKEFGGVIDGAQTVEKAMPAAQFKMQHNLYELLGDVVMGSLHEGRLDPDQAKGYIDELLNMKFMLDFENKYGVNFQTGPSDISPGTRDFNLQFTRDF